MPTEVDGIFVEVDAATVLTMMVDADQAIYEGADSSELRNGIVCFCAHLA